MAVLDGQKTSDIIADAERMAQGLSPRAAGSGVRLTNAFNDTNSFDIPPGFNLSEDEKQKFALRDNKAVIGTGVAVALNEITNTQTQARKTRDFLTLQELNETAKKLEDKYTKALDQMIAAAEVERDQAWANLVRTRDGRRITAEKRREIREILKQKYFDDPSGDVSLDENGALQDKKAEKYLQEYEKLMRERTGDPNFTVDRTSRRSVYRSLEKYDEMLEAQDKVDAVVEKRQVEIHKDTEEKVVALKTLPQRYEALKTTDRTNLTDQQKAQLDNELEKISLTIVTDMSVDKEIRDQIVKDNGWDEEFVAEQMQLSQKQKEDAEKENQSPNIPRENTSDASNDKRPATQAASLSAGK